MRLQRLIDPSLYTGQNCLESRYEGIHNHIIPTIPLQPLSYALTVYTLFPSP